MTKFITKDNLDPNAFEFDNINKVIRPYSVFGVGALALNIKDYAHLAVGNDWTAALAAAYAALPDRSGTEQGGGTILFPPGKYELHQIDFYRNKPVALVGLGRSQGNYSVFQNSSLNAATLVGLDTGLGSRILSVTTQQGGETNGYGFQFRNIQFDLTNGTQFGFYAENTNFVRFEDCAAAGEADPQSIPQWMIRGLNTFSFGEADSSWWRVINCNANRCGLAWMGDVANLNNNHHIFMHNLVVPGSQVDACIKLTYGTRCATFANNLESGPNTAAGLILDNHTLGTFIGDAGESTGAQTAFIVARNSYNNILMPAGNTSSGGTEKLIDDDRSNLVLTAMGVKDYEGQQDNHFALADPSLRHFGMTANGLISSQMADLPHWISTKNWNLFEEPTDVATVGAITCEYWDGSNWQLWNPTNLQNISVKNSQRVEVDAAHKKFRLSVPNVPTTDAPVVLLQFFPSATGTDKQDMPVVIEVFDSGSNVIQTRSFSIKLRDSSLFNGFIYPLKGPIGGGKLQVTLDAPLSGAQKIYLQRFRVLIRGMDGTRSPSWIISGVGSPEGVVTAKIGTLFSRGDGDINTALYFKASGDGTNTGWLSAGAWNSSRLSPVIHAAPAKPILVDADEVGISDSENSWALKKANFASIRTSINAAMPLTSSDDLNNIKTSGAYYWETSLPSNNMGSRNYSLLEVNEFNGRVLQTQSQLTYNAGVNYQYTRIFDGTAWTGWQKIINANSIEQNLTRDNGNPVVTGTVFNATNPIPTKVSANATVAWPSGAKSAIYVADTAGGTFTLTLPASPAAGWRVKIYDATDNWSTAKLTIGNNGAAIKGVAAPVDLISNGLNPEFVYVDATIGWIY